MVKSYFSFSDVESPVFAQEKESDMDNSLGGLPRVFKVDLLLVEEETAEATNIFE